MNEEIKAHLRQYGGRVRGASFAYNGAKTKLEQFDAATWCSLRADGQKRTEADMKAEVKNAIGRDKIAVELSTAEAEFEAVKADGNMLQSHVALLCSEIAANSRICS